MLENYFFRGWFDGLGGDIPAMFVEGSLLNEGKDHFTIISGNEGFTVEKETIGQFTGVKDVTGKQIFSGDIVVIDGYPFYGDDELEELNYVGEVYYWEEETSFYVTLHVVSDRVAGRACGGIMSEYFNRLRVIGNTKETPELLKINATK